MIRETDRRGVVCRICDDCGEQKEIRRSRIMEIRKRRGDDCDYCWSCANKRRRHPRNESNKNWKHGINNGYRRINQNGRRVLEHTVVMEKLLGRELYEGETIHHIDLNKVNNDPQNLWLYKSNSEHRVAHQSLQRVTICFLSKQLWFNWKTKQYQLNWCDQPELVDIDLGLKLYSKRIRGVEYVCYKEGRSWRRYHVAVAETMLGRSLYNRECVHHVDLQTTNNLSTNLCVTTNTEHGKIHASLESCGIQLMACGLIVFCEGQYLETQSDRQTASANNS